MNRSCWYCKKVRRTTNKKDKPYVCEICLRDRARTLLLTWKDIIAETIAGAKEDIKVKCFVSFVVGLAIGVVIMLIV